MKLMAILLTLCLILCGCNTIQVSNEVYYSFTDSVGNEIILTHKPERIAVLFSSYAEIWSVAGGRVDITVAESIERGFADSNAVLVDDKSGHTAINTELLIASKPDLVIATADHDIQVETAELCNNNGIPSALFRVENFEDYLYMLEICCNITGNTDNYTKYGTDIKKEIDALLPSVPDEDNKILFVRAGSAARSTKAKTKDDNFVCRMLYELGTYNIAENAPILLDGLSLEEIVNEKPEHIFVTTMGDETAAKEYMASLLSSEGWCELEAEVTYLPKEMFHYKPNARWYEAYLYLYEILYD